MSNTARVHSPAEPAVGFGGLKTSVCIAMATLLKVGVTNTTGSAINPDDENAVGEAVLELGFDTPSR